jgi:hypothetical protein
MGVGGGGVGLDSRGMESSKKEGGILVYYRGGGGRLTCQLIKPALIAKDLRQMRVILRNHWW